MKRFSVFFLLCLMAGGCAFTKANLNVAYDPTKAEKGPLSSVMPLKVNIPKLTDSRPNQNIIGRKINGIGMETADVVTKQPVPEITRAALVALFEKNGHLVKESGAQVTVDGEIKEFWLKLQMNVMTIEFMGTETLALNVKDANQKTIYSREYQGYYDEKKAAGLNKTWERVMNIALEKLMYQIATDEELAKVLKIQTVQTEESTKPSSAQF